MWSGVRPRVSVMRMASSIDSATSASAAPHIRIEHSFEPPIEHSDRTFIRAPDRTFESNTRSSTRSNIRSNIRSSTRSNTRTKPAAMALSESTERTGGWTASKGISEHADDEISRRHEEADRSTYQSLNSSMMADRSTYRSLNSSMMADRSTSVESLQGASDVYRHFSC